MNAGWYRWNHSRRFAICLKWAEKLKSCISPAVLYSDFTAQTRRCFFSVVYMNAIDVQRSFITLALYCWYLTTHCRDLQGTKAIQPWPQRGWNQGSSSWNSLWKKLVRGNQWWEKKRHQLWPAIQLPLSFLCLTHHTQLITAIHSTVCLRHQTTITAHSIIWEQTFVAKLSTFVHTKPFFPACFLVTLWHRHFFSLLQ